MGSDDGTKAGTIGGTILTIVYNIKLADIEKTIVLASIGAVVSFTISIILKKVVNHYMKK